MAAPSRLSKEERQVLAQGELLVQLSQNRGWLEVLKPWLEDRLHNSWLDPTKIKDTKEFLYQYAFAWSFAKAVGEILAFVDQAKNETERLRKKEKGETVDKFNKVWRKGGKK